MHVVIQKICKPATRMEKKLNDLSRKRAANKICSNCNVSLLFVSVQNAKMEIQENS
jgi:hypothetical protein